MAGVAGICRTGGAAGGVKYQPPLASSHVSSSDPTWRKEPSCASGEVKHSARACVGHGGGLPGTVRAPEDLLQALYQNGAPFDVVARHPFTHPLETVDTLRQKMHTIRQIMTQHGDNFTQLWVTEYTPSTKLGHPGGLSEEEQASWLSQSIRVLPNEHLADKVFWYSLRDTVVDSDPFFAYSGLVHHDLTPKPAWYSFCQLVNEYS